MRALLSATNLKIALALSAAAMMAACSDGLEPQAVSDAPQKGQVITVGATQGGEADTRLAYAPNADGSIGVTWADGDKIYIGKVSDVEDYLEGSQSSVSNQWGTFTLKSITDTDKKQATFEGTPKTTWANGDKLFAFYGGSKGEHYFEDLAPYYRLDYTGQEQTGNNNTKHLAGFDYMAASDDYTTGSSPNFKFNRYGAVLKMVLTVPDDLVDKPVTEIKLRTPEGDYLAANIRIPLETGTAFVGRKVSEISLSLTNVTVLSDKIIRAYIMLPAIDEVADLTGRTLAINATIGSVAYCTKVTARKLAAGMCYTVEKNLMPIGSLFDGGTGTESEPYQIKTKEQLENMRDHLVAIGDNKYFQLTDNINLEGEEWAPIGKKSLNPFKGTFDGNGKTISGLKISAGNEYTGLFGYITSATIKNLTVEGNVTGGTGAYAGGIVGRGTNATIINCSYSGSVNADATTQDITLGGIAGQLNGKILFCKNEAAVGLTSRTGTGSKNKLQIGGIVGKVTSTVSVVGCLNEGDISWVGKSNDGTLSMGGIVGHAFDAVGVNLYGCYNKGAIRDTGGDEYYGGLIGCCSSSAANLTSSGSHWTDVADDKATQSIGGPGSVGSSSKLVPPTETVDATLAGNLNAGITEAQTNGKISAAENTHLFVYEGNDLILKANNP